MSSYPTAHKCLDVVIVAPPLRRVADSDQSFDQADVSPDVLTHAVRDLDRPAHGGARIPPGARDAHPVCAGKPKLGGWRHRLGPVHAAAAWTASVPLVATRFTATASSRYSESVPAWVASSPTASTCAAIDRSNARSEPSPVIAGVAPP